VRDWLHFLKQNNLLYSNITIKNKHPQQIPNDGSILDQLRTTPGATNPSNQLTTTHELQSTNEQQHQPNSSQEDDENDLTTQQIGPKQGGASESLQEDTKEELKDNHFEAPAISTYQLRRHLQANFGITNNPIQWSDENSLMSDYTTPNLQDLSFPPLSPFGVGDTTNHDDDLIIRSQ